jgi:hypothetical protein
LQYLHICNFFAPILLLISSHFSTRGSQVRCEVANYVSKFGNWARSSQVHFTVWTLFFIIICSSLMHVQEQRTVHVYFLFYNNSVHFRSLKDDFTKIRTLARTLHEQALRNSTLRNSEFSDGIANIKIYYSGCIVQQNLNFDPWLPF